MNVGRPRTAYFDGEELDDAGRSILVVIVPVHRRQEGLYGFPRSLGRGNQILLVRKSVFM